MKILLLGQTPCNARTKQPKFHISDKSNIILHRIISVVYLDLFPTRKKSSFYDLTRWVPRRPKLQQQCKPWTLLWLMCATWKMKLKCSNCKICIVLLFCFKIQNVTVNRNSLSVEYLVARRSAVSSPYPPDSSSSGNRCEPSPKSYESLSSEDSPGNCLYW